MRLRTRGQSFLTKPGVSTRLNLASPACRGLVYYGAFNEAGGVPQNSPGLAPVAPPAATSIGWGWSDKGSAITFNGSSYLTLNSTGASVFDLTGAFTFVARCLFTSFASNATIIAKDYSGTNINYILRVNAGAGNKLQIFGGGTNVTGGTAIATNTWYTLAATYDMTTLSVWVNGIVDGSTAASSAGNVSSQGVTVGTRPVVADSMSGSIDYFGIWNRALSAAEIMRFHTQPYHLFLGRRSPLPGVSVNASYGAFLRGQTVGHSLFSTGF